MSLQQSSVLVDRALVTLCTELPESLGLYNTVKDQFSLSAMRSVPNLENLVFESKKHLIIRDWMRSYQPKEDQPLTKEISMDVLKQTLREEKRKNANHARGMNEDMMASSSAGASSSTSASKSSSAAHAQRKKEKRDKKEAAKKAAKASGNGKAKAKAPRSKDSSGKTKKDRSSSSGKAASKKVRRRRDSGESESESEYDSSESSSESSTSSSSDSEREETKSSKSAQTAGKKKAKNANNLPPVELVLSSDEDDEPNDLFDTEDPDVYEVESILDKRKGRSFGEPDMYLIKWVGYEETSWEPAENVSKDLIEEFEGQPVRENEYIVEEIRDRKSTRDKETKLKTFKYLIKWVGYEDLTWEPAENLPHNLRRKFDQKFEARKRRKTK